MKNFVIRLLINAVLVLLAAELTKHYYDIGLITSNAVIRVGVLCIIHLIYISVTEGKKALKEEA